MSFPSFWLSVSLVAVQHMCPPFVNWIVLYVIRDPRPSPPNVFDRALPSLNASLWHRCPSFFNSFPFRLDTGRSVLGVFRSLSSRKHVSGSWIHSPPIVRLSDSHPPVSFLAAPFFFSPPRLQSSCTYSVPYLLGFLCSFPLGVWQMFYVFVVVYGYSPVSDGSFSSFSCCRDYAAVFLCFKPLHHLGGPPCKRIELH